MTKPNVLRRLGFFSVCTKMISSVILVSAVVFWETVTKAEAHQNNRFSWVTSGMMSKLQIIMDNMTHSAHAMLVGMRSTFCSSNLTTGSTTEGHLCLLPSDCTTQPLCSRRTVRRPEYTTLT